MQNEQYKVHTGSMTARVEKNPQEFEAILHPSQDVAGIDTYILEVINPELRNHCFYLVQLATEQDIAQEWHYVNGAIVILIRTQWADPATESFECLVWFVLWSDDGYAHTETMEDAERARAYRREHTEELARGGSEDSWVARLWSLLRGTWRARLARNVHQ